jgi:hypothetical protein
MVTLFSPSQPLGQRNKTPMWNSIQELSQLIDILQVAALVTIIAAGALVAFLILASQRREELKERDRGIGQTSKTRPARFSSATMVLGRKAEYFDLLPASAGGAMTVTRTISAEQRFRLVNAARQLPCKHSVFVTSVRGNPDSEGYAQQLRTGLAEAGWDVQCVTLDPPAGCSTAGVDFVVPLGAKRETVVLWKIFQSAGLRWSQIRYERPSVGDGIEIRVGADPFSQPLPADSIEQSELATASMLVSSSNQGVGVTTSSDRFPS